MSDTPDNLQSLLISSSSANATADVDVPTPENTTIDATLVPSSVISPNGPVSDELASSKITKDNRYYFDFVEFLVEDSLFRVPKYQFEKPPSRFGEIFKTVLDDGEAVKLQNIRKEDFVSFLKLLYPDATDDDEPTSFDEWKLILELTFRWGMYRFFEIARDALQEAPLHEQVLLARKCGVYQWLKSAYITLAKRNVFLSQEEAVSLGLEATVKLAYVREIFFRSSLKQSHWGSGYQGATEEPEISVLREQAGGAISSELEQLRQFDAPQKIVDQIVMGRGHRLVHWVEHGYQALLNRVESISLHEGSVLGLAITVDLCTMREKKVRPKTQQTYNGFGGYSSFLGIDIEAEVLNQFGEELNGLEEINGAYGTSKPPSWKEPLDQELLPLQKASGKKKKGSKKR